MARFNPDHPQELEVNPGEDTLGDEGKWLRSLFAADSGDETAACAPAPDPDRVRAYLHGSLPQIVMEETRELIAAFPAWHREMGKVLRQEFLGGRFHVRGDARAGRG